jgi:UDP-galactopyranose mutase
MTAPASAIVIGAGMTGATIARILADAGVRVEVLERGVAVGGLCADAFDPYGVLVQTFGPHFFHTNDQAVWDFVNRFASFNTCKHRVEARYQGKLYPFPVNLNTMAITGRDETTQQGPEPTDNAQAYLNWKIGPKLTTMFFAGYSLKQWGVPLSEIPAWVVKRVAPRDSRDDNFFLDQYQGVPSHGYTNMVRAMLAHHMIQVRLNNPVQSEFHIPEIANKSCPVAYTGSLDQFNSYIRDRLPYRRTKFVHVNVPRHNMALASTSVNECDPETEYIRVTDNAQMNRQPTPFTTLTFEYPGRTWDDSVPCYPIPWDEKAKTLHSVYLGQLRARPLVYAAGRLADYKYYNMDQAILRGMEVAKLILAGKPQQET